MGMSHTYIQFRDDRELEVDEALSSSSEGVVLKTADHGTIIVRYPWPHQTVDDELFMGELRRLIDGFRNRHKEERDVDKNFP